MSKKTLGRWAVRLALGIAVGLGVAISGAAASSHSHALAEVGWQMAPLEWADGNVAQ